MISVVYSFYLDFDFRSNHITARPSSHVGHSSDRF